MPPHSSPLPDEHQLQALLSGAERQADADLARPLRDRVGDHRVDPDRRQQQGHAAADAEQRQREGGPRHRLVVDLLHRLHLRDRQSSRSPPTTARRISAA